MCCLTVSFVQCAHYDELSLLHAQHRLSNTIERCSHGKLSKGKPDQHQPTLGVCILPTTVSKKLSFGNLGEFVEHLVSCATLYCCFESLS